MYSKFFLAGLDGILTIDLVINLKSSIVLLISNDRIYLHVTAKAGHY